VCDAIRLLAARAHVVAEGAGACAVAAAATETAGEGPIVAVVSGGNIDTDVFTTILEGVVP
jgi:threonine dehydratase